MSYVIWLGCGAVALGLSALLDIYERKVEHRNTPMEFVAAAVMCALLGPVSLTVMLALLVRVAIVEGFVFAGYLVNRARYWWRGNGDDAVR